MFVLLIAFTLVHAAVGTASLSLGVRLLTEEEEAHWRSAKALFVARLLCWIYPVIAFVFASLSWRAFEAAEPHALVLLIAPFLWFVLMGIVFAVVDFAEDGILGNARSRD